MKVGLFLPHVGEHITAENILYIATEAEKEGIDSVWVLDRLLWPIKPQTPYVASPDGSLPVVYQNLINPTHRDYAEPTNNPDRWTVTVTNPGPNPIDIRAFAVCAKLVDVP